MRTSNCEWSLNQMRSGASFSRSKTQSSLSRQLRSGKRYTQPEGVDAPYFSLLPHRLLTAFKSKHTERNWEILLRFFRKTLLGFNNDFSHKNLHTPFYFHLMLCFYNEVSWWETQQHATCSERSHQCSVPLCPSVAAVTDSLGTAWSLMWMKWDASCHFLIALDRTPSQLTQKFCACATMPFLSVSQCRTLPFQLKLCYLSST